MLEEFRLSSDLKLFGEDKIGGGDVVQFIERLFADDNQHYKKKKLWLL